MAEFRRLTYKTSNGAWGIEGVSLLTCPARLYGVAAKLCDMESLCEDVYRAKDAGLPAANVIPMLQCQNCNYAAPTTGTYEQVNCRDERGYQYGR